MITPRASLRPLLAILGLALLAACTEAPTATSDPVAPSFAKGGKPGPNTDDCGFTPLSITFGDAAGDALMSDALGPYEENVDNVGAHLNGATGRLMLWTSQYGDPTRFVTVSTTEPFEGPTSDRIYTNGHDSETAQDLGCGLKDIAHGGAGSAVLEVELDAEGIVRYGKDCDGSPVGSTRIDITRSGDGLSWTVEGSTGVHCRSNGLRGKNAAMVPVGTTGPFSMTLVDITDQ